MHQIHISLINVIGVYIFTYAVFTCTSHKYTINVVFTQHYGTIQDLYNRAELGLGMSTFGCILKKLWWHSITDIGLK